MKKRWIAWVLTVAMCLSMFPVDVLAADEEDTENGEIIFSEKENAEPTPEQESDGTNDGENTTPPQENGTEPAENVGAAVLAVSGEDGQTEDLTAGEGVPETETVENGADGIADTDEAEGAAEDGEDDGTAEDGEVNGEDGGDGEEDTTIVASGECGDNLTWTLDEDGLLTIEGTGNMYNYGSGKSPWYNYRFAIISVVTGESVTSIEDHAFQDCTNLESVELPEGVTTIGEAAFERTALNTVSLPENLKSLGEYAFNGCTGLSEIELPENLKSLGAYAFNGCTGLSEIELPEGLESLGRNVFGGTKLKELVIPAGVTAMGDKGGYGSDGGYHRSALCGAEELTKVVFAGERTTLPFGALRYCEQVTEIVLPEGLESISGYCFSACTSLESLTLPDTVTVIEDHAFNGCTGLSEIELPENLKSLGRNVFGGTKLKELVIPAGVTAMGDKGGHGSDGGYHRSALCGAEELTKVVFAGERTTLPFGALRCCEQVTEIVLPEGLESISGYCFSVCTSLESLTLPDTVTVIEDHAFIGCTGLKSVELPEGVTTIGEAAFERTALNTVSLPENLKSLGAYAFYGCSGLSEIELPENLKSLGRNVFWGTKLKELVIPAGVTAMGDKGGYGSDGYHRSALCGAEELTKVVFAGERTTLPFGALRYCEQVTEIVLPEGLESISGYCFSACTSLESLTLPDTVTVIENHAFADSGVTDMYFSGPKELWDTVHVANGNDQLLNATAHFGHTHDFGEWTNIVAPTCTEKGVRYRVCPECELGQYELLPETDHCYETRVVEPTFLEQGYTEHVCSECGDTYKDEYTDALPRTDITLAALELEYTSAFYKGVELRPAVSVSYGGVNYDPAEELEICYSDNTHVGTATVTIEGVNRFEGTAELTFDISYEVVPAQLVNVAALSDIDRIIVFWSPSSEVNTDTYRIYRKAEGDEDFACVGTVYGRKNVSYIDTDVEQSKLYSYYVTGVGLYGAESEPSRSVSVRVEKDRIAPVALKITPPRGTALAGKIPLKLVATDNVGAVESVYFYSVDNRETWVQIGVGTGESLAVDFDTTFMTSGTVAVKAVARDAEGNESEPVFTEYSVDNEGPDQVCGLSAESVSSKITLSWTPVAASDAACYVVQILADTGWKTLASNVTTLGYVIEGLNPEEEYTFRVACVDSLGNIGAFSESYSARTSGDITSPVITEMKPAAERYNRAIDFSASAMDDCDVRQIRIQISTDTENWTDLETKTYNERKNVQTASCVIDLSSYAEGSIFARAVATDFSGNVSDESDAAPYTEYIVDRTAPEAPTGVAAEGNDGYITVSWDRGAEQDPGFYYVYRSDAEDGVYEQIAGNLTYLNFHDQKTERGCKYYYAVAAADSCGNLSEKSAVVSALMAEDTQCPEILSISETPDRKIGREDPTVYVGATDNYRLSQVVVDVRSSANPEYVRLLTVEEIGKRYENIPVTLPLEELRDGDRIGLRVYAVDEEGLRSETVTAEYTLDEKAPAAIDYDLALNASTVTLSWKDGGENDLYGFRIYRSADGESYTLLGARAADASGSYSFTDSLSGLEQRTYFYKLDAFDKLGNTATWLKTVNWEPLNEAPEAKMTIPEYMAIGVEEFFDASESTDDVVIMDYFWDFGDGTTATEMKSVKRYEETGTYTVTLTVTDNEGVSSDITEVVEVKERDLLGTLQVKVTDENGNLLYGVPVYFDLGTENQRVVYTNPFGLAAMLLPTGKHKIGIYASGYLPVRKDAVVLSNAERTVTLSTTKEDIVSGGFEIRRMTFEEIVAAGIDVHDPANQNVYTATVRFRYGVLTYTRNDTTILTVGGKSGNLGALYIDGRSGEGRMVFPKILGTSGDGNDVIAILDVPTKASFLKDFFDVRLHIINNSSSEFELVKNEVALNVPAGMTVMGGGSVRKIGSIRGQESVTLSWVLRGDQTGYYPISADFTGILAEFNELVTAHFETEEPLHVYGLEGIKFRILGSDRIYNDAFYFNLELENQRDIDLYLPALGLTDKVKNVTESVLHNNPDGDFYVESYLLNAYIQTEGGEKYYLPITFDENGNAGANVETLAPGQKIVYEYVAYNAINFDGAARFLDATVMEFEGLLENIEVGSFSRVLYSFEDTEDKLTEIFAEDGDRAGAMNYICDDSRYWYVHESDRLSTSIFQVLYNTILNPMLSGDLKGLTQEEERSLAQELLFKVISDADSMKAVDDLVASKYLETVRSVISNTKTELIDYYTKNPELWQSPGSFSEYTEHEPFDISDFPAGTDPSEVDAYLDNVLKSISKDELDLAATLINEGKQAFLEKLESKLVGYGIGASLNSLNISFDKAFQDQMKYTQMLLPIILDAVSETQRDAYIYSALKLECSEEYCDYVLDAVIQNTDDMRVKLAAIDLQLKMKSQISEMDFAVLSLTANITKGVAETAIQTSITAIMATALAASPAAIIAVAAMKLALQFANVDNYIKQEETLDIYNEVSSALAKSFRKNGPKAQTLEEKGYALCVLKALCAMRLEGENQFKSFINDYINGKFGLPIKEEKVLSQINKAMGTSFATMDAWWDNVQFNILQSRDILFNVEMLSDTTRPGAPTVGLNYETGKTVQSFSSEYEYCFGDGVWTECNGAPIKFTVGSVPGILRVRVAATDTTLAGEIRTVRIFARKDLSKLISARFDGMNYLFDHLSSQYSYQFIFTDNPDQEANWTGIEEVPGSDSTLKISGVSEYSYVILRSCQNYDKNETASNPLVLAVNKKKPLNLTIEGDGTVSQSAVSGCYFAGEDVYLHAEPIPGCLFLGWFINGVCVSEDKEYLVEMAEDLEIRARFTGVGISRIVIEQLPVKLDYLEGEALSLTGLRLAVIYSDDTTIYPDDFTAYLSSNSVGKVIVVVGYGGYSTGFEVTIHENAESHKIHDIITIPEKEPTCTEDGFTESVACAECGKTFEKAAIIPALGHRIIVTPAAEPTAEAPGLTEGSYCDRCGEVFAEQRSYMGLTLTAPESLMGGKNVTVTATYLPGNIDKDTLIWTLGEGESQYAALSTSGKLTAKTVTEAVTVHVTAAGKKNPLTTATVEITIYPAAAAVNVMRGDEGVTGKTLELDLNSQPSITLSASTAPADAMDDVQWTCSDTKGAYGVLTDNGDGTATFTSTTDKTGSVTLTAKATDGSGKSAKVTIKIGKLAGDIEITNAPTEMRGGAAVTLKTSIDSDRTLTDRNVEWTLSDDSIPYATLSKNKLTTRKVYEQITIHVTGTVKARPELSQTIDILLYPDTTEARIEYNGVLRAKNESIPVRLSDGTVQLTGSTFPVDAMQEGTWKSSSTKIATVDENGIVTLLKAGTVTITFTAADGSKKNTTVKLVIGNWVEDIGFAGLNDQDELELLSGKSATVKAAVTPADATNKKLVWSTEDKNIATVSNGRVTAKTVRREETVTITATAADNGGADNFFKVIVRPAKDTLSIWDSGTDVTGKTLTMAYTEGFTYTPAAMLYSVADNGFDTADVTWKSSNAKIATVDENGVVTYLKAGSATFTAQCGKLTAKLTIKTIIPVDSVTITDPQLTELVSGKNVTLKTTVLPINAANKKLVWQSSDPAAATVSSSGKVTAKAVTERTDVIITATAADGSGAYAEYTLTIVPKATGITIRDNLFRVMNNRSDSISMSARPQLQLSATVFPNTSKGAQQGVTWTSSNKAIAAIDENGSVTLLKKGTVTIKATAADGSKVNASFKIIVTE